MLGIGFWMVPLFSGIVWGAMLITMLVYWGTTGKPIYPGMEEGQTIPFISDIGADTLKPLFIAMSAVNVVIFDIAFIAERWFRHTGKLASNTSYWQKIYSFFAIIFAIAGAAGLILLTIFDTVHYTHQHDIFLCIFIGGYIISAIFICWEYQRLGIHYREHSVLRYSFWIKLFFIIAEVALVVAFARVPNNTVAAVLEWIVAFFYVAYVLSFSIDFLPAIRTKHHQSYQTEMQMAEEGSSTREMTMHDGAADNSQYYRGANAGPLANGHGHDHGHGHGNADGLTNGWVPHVGHVDGVENGHVYTNGGHAYIADTNGYNGSEVSYHPGYPKPNEPAPLPSRNF